MASSLGAPTASSLARLAGMLRSNDCGAVVVRWPRVGSARPDNHPLLSGTEGQHAQTVTMSGRKHGSLDGPSQDGVPGLLGSESVMAATLGHRLRLHDEVSREHG